MTRRRFGRFALCGKKREQSRNKEQQNRICLEKKKPESGEGESVVVKGVSKRIIVVKSPDPKIFEQAIFIIREDFAGQQGLSEKDILREARRAAGNYLHSENPRSLRVLEKLRAPLYACAGAAAAALAWTAAHFTHVFG